MTPSTGGPDGPPADVPPAFTLTALGQRYAVRVTDPVEVPGLVDEWSRCLGADDHAAEAEPLWVTGGHTPRQNAYALTATVTQRAIQGLRGRCLMLHAAAVADGSGAVVALAGPSGRGKTSAAIALGRAGLGYVTDETVALDPDLAVRPFPRPLAVVDPERPGRAKIQQGPDALGLARPPERLRLAGLLLLARDPAHSGPPRVEPVPLVDALLALVPLTSSLATLPTPLAALAEAVEAAGGLHVVTYAEAEDLAPVVRAAAARPATSSEPTWSRAVLGLPGEDDMAWGLRDGQVRLRPHRDALVTPDDVLVMLDATPVRLSGVGKHVWESLRASTSLVPEQLVATTVAALGPHPEAEAIVGAILDGLRDAGVLAWGAPLPVSAVIPATGDSMRR